MEKIKEKAENNGESGAFAMYSSEDEMCQDGLTKREYFAGLALQSIIAKGGTSEKMITYYAVRFADDLLEELERLKKNI